MCVLCSFVCHCSFLQANYQLASYVHKYSSVYLNSNCNCEIRNTLPIIVSEMAIFTVQNTILIFVSNAHLL